MKEIVITLTNDGELKIETKGFKGEACIKETEALKELLGEETARQLTPAYYDKEGKVKRHLPLCG